MYSRLHQRISGMFTRGSFAHNVLVMFTGTAIGQLGSVILAPVLTRIYAPEMFGVLSAFTAMVIMLSVAATLRYELALPLTRTEEDTANLLAVCMVTLFLTTIAGTCFIMLVPWSSSDVLNVLEPYLLALPIAFFCIGAYQVLVFYATRQEAYAIIARTKIYQGATGPLSQIGLGIATASPWGLIIGFTIGQSTGSFLLFSKLISKTRALKLASFSGMRAIAWRYIRFPLLSSWSSLINIAGSSAILLLLVPVMYSPAIAGFVFLTDRVIGRPLLLISTSVLQVYMGDLSRTLGTDPHAIRSRFLKLTAIQLIIVASWLAIINLAAPYLFPVVFGQEWQGAVPYLHVLSIAYLPQMVIHSLTHTLQILEKQALSAAWEIGRFLAVAGSFVVSYIYDFNALQGLICYSITQAVAQIILFMLMYSSIQSLRKVASYA